MKGKVVLGTIVVLFSMLVSGCINTNPYPLNMSDYNSKLEILNEPKLNSILNLKFSFDSTVPKRYNCSNTSVFFRAGIESSIIKEEKWTEFDCNQSRINIIADVNLTKKGLIYLSFEVVTGNYSENKYVPYEIKFECIQIDESEGNILPSCITSNKISGWDQNINYTTD